MPSSLFSLASAASSRVTRFASEHWIQNTGLPVQLCRAISGVRAAMGKKEQRIREHGTKILVERARAQPEEGRIRHLETEIRAFRDGIERARKRLGERK